MWKPNVLVTSNRALVQYRFIQAGWVPLLLMTVILGAIFIPYFVVLIRGTLHPILPFVSQAAGSPPQSGIFSMLLSLTATISLVGLHVMHMSIRLRSERMEIKNSRNVVNMLNKALLIPGHIAILGMLIIGGYPYDFHRHNDDWLFVTIVPHLTGALSLFLGGIFYFILYTYIMSVIHPEKKELRSTRLTIISIIIFTAALHAATINTAFMKEYYDVNRMKSCEDYIIVYDLQYIICSVCEWALLLGFIAFFATMKDESNCITFAMTVTVDDEPPAATNCEQLAQKVQNDGEKKANGNVVCSEKPIAT